MEKRDGGREEEENGGGEKIIKRYPAPHSSVESPEHAMLQSVAGAWP
jgi:hypothetical protein